MHIRVKLFATLREHAGTGEVTLHLEPGSSVADAAAAVAKQFPAVARHLPRVAYAVNESYAKPDAPLHEGDELALIPPVSGG